MRQLVRTEIGLVVVFTVAVLVCYIGAAVAITGRDRFAGYAVLVLGLWLLVAAPVVHDRVHRERGEQSHALWGRDDRRKPRWWPTR